MRVTIHSPSTKVRTLKLSVPFAGFDISLCPKCTAHWHLFQTLPYLPSTLTLPKTPCMLIQRAAPIDVPSSSRCRRLVDLRATFLHTLLTFLHCQILETYLFVLAPMAPHLAEEIYHFSQGATADPSPGNVGAGSVFQKIWTPLVRPMICRFPRCQCLLTADSADRMRLGEMKLLSLKWRHSLSYEKRYWSCLSRLDMPSQWNCFFIRLN